MNRTSITNIRPIISHRLAALYRDERGTISVMSVVTIFVLVIVLGMVVNAGRQVDEKVRMQNAADAVTYSGAVVMARGLNALAFSNRVEAEVFALTAYMRAGVNMSGQPSDPQAKQNLQTFIEMENAILDAWNTVGAIFAKSSFPKFAALGKAIQPKVPIEKALVQQFLQMTNLQAKLVLPVFESILRGDSQPGGTPDPMGGFIPRFQRSLVLYTPQSAQTVASEVARMHGNMTTQGKLSGLEKLHRRQPLTAVLWRTNATPISMGNEYDPLQRALPVIDASLESQSGAGQGGTGQGAYLELARCQRRRWAFHLLDDLWNPYLLDPFYRGYPLQNPFPPYNYLPGGASAGKASSLFFVWKNYTCAQLNKLLDDEKYGYPRTNLPFVYRVPGAFPSAAAGAQADDCDGLIKDYRDSLYKAVDPLQNTQLPSHLEQYHHFVGVVYWPAMQQTSPFFFRYPLASDSMAFAQASVFIPRARYQKNSPYSDVAWLHPTRRDPSTGIQLYGNNYDNWPQDWNALAPVLHPINLQWIPHWDVSNQNWMAQLVPATSDAVPAILQSSQAQQIVPNVRVPNLGGLGPGDLRRINTH